MMGNEGISVADALALRGNGGYNGGSGFGGWGGDGAWWIIILILLFGAGGWNRGGFGGNGGGSRIRWVFGATKQTVPNNCLSVGN